LVTLLILKSLIEKTPRDLPLYAASTIQIFKCILLSQDVTMIEDSVPAFAAFCAHQDPVNLAANQEYIRQYEEIVQLYASFASKDNPVPHKNAKSVPLRIRFRKAGLAAIKAIAQSDTITAETARQLSLIVPSILENIYSEDGNYLIELEQFEEHKAEVEKELGFKRRQSTTIATPAVPNVPDPIAAAGSIEAADALAEQETGGIALQALKQIFAAVPQSQLRLATAEVLKFLGDRINHRDHFPAGSVIPLQSGSWPCRLMGLICAWAPVGDRHSILLTAVEELVKTPFQEEEFEKHYVLATITGWLLSSEINFIGLSVMDVLVALLQHISTLLNTPIPGPASLKEQENGADLEKDDIPEIEHDNFESSYSSVAFKAQLLSQFQRCIGCLAVHVYYSDQVGDMIGAILSRLRAPRPSSIHENGTTATDGAASTTSLTRKKSFDGYFVSDRAKVAALRSIKEILIWANWVKTDGISSSSSRNSITIDRWEGTHWLLKDESWIVRLAYVDVLLIWMKRELKKSNLRVVEPATQRRGSKREKDKKDSVAKEGSLAKRAVSNASQRDKSPHRSKTTFLPMLHLAVYDNAHQWGASDNDILLLHLLLSTLIEKLGVNSAQHGLPMICRLQEDLNEFEDASSKINVGSLAHGYLWALSAYFHFDASATGRDIALEISERAKKGIWLHTLKVPSIPLEEVAQRRTTSVEPPPMDAIEFHPFTKFSVVVDKMAQGYEVTLYSPPSSPPTSPMRKFSSTPMLEQAAPVDQKKPSNNLPDSAKAALLSDWTREAIIAANAPQESSRSGSLSGTSPTNGSGKHLSVGVAQYNSGMNGDLAPSPRRSMYGHPNHHPHTSSAYRGSRPVSAAQGARDAQYHPHAFREALMLTAGTSSRARTSHAGTQYTTSSVRSSVRVEDLKRVLSGAAPSTITSAPILDQPEDSASDSMISYDGSEFSATLSRPEKLATADTELDETEITVQNGAATEGSVTPRPPTAVSSGSGRPTSRSRSNSSPEPETEDDEIPPVPPVPDTYASFSPGRTSTSSSHQTIGKTTSLHIISPPQSPVLLPTTRPKLTSSPTSAAKAESIRSATVRESLRRSISTRDGAVPSLPILTDTDALYPHSHYPKGVWSALDLLEAIEAEGPSPPPGSATNKPLGGRLKPPY
jgi:protein EFR3